MLPSLLYEKQHFSLSTSFSLFYRLFRRAQSYKPVKYIYCGFNQILLNSFEVPIKYKFLQTINKITNYI